MPLLLASCANVPKYKRSNGKFDEWRSYEGTNFGPHSGTLVAVDVQGNTVTIVRGKNQRVYPVTADTRVMHEGTDIPLSKLPLNQQIKFTVSDDGQRLLTIWYGKGVAPLRAAPPPKAERNTYL